MVGLIVLYICQLSSHEHMVLHKPTMHVYEDGINSDVIRIQNCFGNNGGRVKTICNMNYTISEFTSILYSTHIALTLY